MDSSSCNYLLCCLIFVLLVWFSIHWHHQCRMRCQEIDRGSKEERRPKKRTWTAVHTDIEKWTAVHTDIAKWTAVHTEIANPILWDFSPQSLWWTYWMFKFYSVPVENYPRRLRVRMEARTRRSQSTQATTTIQCTVPVGPHTQVLSAHIALVVFRAVVDRKKMFARS